MKKATLGALASQFHHRLKSIKSATPLDGRKWYPWDSLAGLDVLSSFLGGNMDAFRQLTGGDPVLDVGCGDGDVAFFLESLGLRMDAIDLAPTNYNAMDGVRTLKRLLSSSVGIHIVDLDTRPHLPASNYGLTIMLGLLYHLKNPFLVLETLARNSRHIFLSTRIASLTPDHKIDFGGLPMAYLVGEDELNQDSTNFWIFSEGGLRRLIQRSGWEVLHYATTGASAGAADPVHPQGDVRAYILARSRLMPLHSGFELERGWHRVELGSWRWTERVFSVQLNLSGPLAPATLRFLFHVPREALAQRPALTMTGKVNGETLAPATYSTPGEHEYAGTLPSVAAGAVQVEFELDLALRPTGGDQRELGVFVDFSGSFPVSLG